MDYTVTLTTDDGPIPVTSLELDFPEDGSPGRGQIVLSGDHEALHSVTGLTVTITQGASSLTIGPLVGLGDVTIDGAGDAATTTIEVAESREQEPTLGELVTGEHDLLDVIERALDGVEHSPLDLRALLTPVLDGVIVTGVIKDRLGHTLARRTLKTDGKTPRSLLQELLSPLGYGVAYHGQTLTVTPPATADVVPNSSYETQRRERLSAQVPTHVSVTGAEVTLTGGVPVQYLGRSPRFDVADYSDGTLTLEWQPENDDEIAYVIERVSPSGFVADRPDWTRASALAQLDRDGDGVQRYQRAFTGDAGRHALRLIAVREPRPGYEVQATPSLAVEITLGGEDQLLKNFDAAGSARMVEVRWSAASDTTYQLTLIRVHGDGTEEVVSSATPVTSHVLFTGSPPTRATMEQVAVDVPPGAYRVLLDATRLSTAQESSQARDVTVTEAFTPIHIDALPSPTQIIASWTGDNAPGGYLVTLGLGTVGVLTQTVYERRVALTGLTPDTTYTLRVEYVDDSAQAGEQSVTTQPESQYDLTDQMVRFELAEDIVITVVAEGSDGDTTTTTLTKRGGVLVREDIQQSGTRSLPRQDADGNDIHITYTGVLAQTIRTHLYGIPGFPEVETAVEGVTTTYGPKDETDTSQTPKTRSVELTVNRWNRAGWLESVTEELRVQYPGRPAGTWDTRTASTRTVINAPLGAGRWLQIPSGTVTTYTYVYADDGTLDSLEMVPIALREPPVSSDSPPPHVVLKTDRDTPLSLPDDTTHVRQLADRPEADEAWPYREPGAAGGDQQLTVTLSTTRDTGGYGPEQSVALPWVSDPLVLERLATLIAAQVGRPIRRATRRYFTPILPARGGGVRSVRLSLDSDGCETELATEWRE